MYENRETQTPGYAPAVGSPRGRRHRRGLHPYIDAYENVAASVEPLEGNELLRAEQFESTLTHRVRTRYYAGVRPHWRIQYGSRVFDIKHVIDPEERHRELEMMCQELVTW